MMRYGVCEIALVEAASSAGPRQDSPERSESARPSIQRMLSTCATTSTAPTAAAAAPPVTTASEKERPTRQRFAVRHVTEKSAPSGSPSASTRWLARSPWYPAQPFGRPCPK